MFTKLILILIGALAMAMLLLLVLTPAYENGVATDFFNYWFGW